MRFYTDRHATIAHSDTTQREQAATRTCCPSQKVHPHTLVRLRLPNEETVELLQSRPPLKVAPFFNNWQETVATEKRHAEFLFSGLEIAVRLAASFFLHLSSLVLLFLAACNVDLVPEWMCGC